MKASSTHHQPTGRRCHKPIPIWMLECGHNARSCGCIGQSNRKCEKTANPAARATARPRLQKKLEKSTAHTMDIASECDQSMKSTEKPGLMPGVTVTFSMPSITKMPNSTSRNPTPRDRKSTRLNSSHLGISYAV